MDAPHEHIRAIINKHADYMDGLDRGMRHFSRESVKKMVSEALLHDLTLDEQAVAGSKAIAHLQKLLQGEVERNAKLREKITATPGITQNDRDVAADLAHRIYGLRVADIIRSGEADNHHLVQTLSSYRISQSVWSQP